MLGTGDEKQREFQFQPSKMRQVIIIQCSMSYNKFIPTGYSEGIDMGGFSVLWMNS